MLLISAIGISHAQDPTFAQFYQFRTYLNPAATGSEKGLNVAENVLKWGTGGLNIDGCRVGTEILPEQKAGQARIGTFERKNMVTPERVGRFPANLILDGSDKVERLFPKTKPSGSASRFFYHAEFTEEDYQPIFYCPKASSSERNMGLNKTKEGKSEHPTVKPLALIEYLVKLTTRKGKTVLDPFIGSGTTGMACKKLGINYIGIELNPDYIRIAEDRIKNVVVKHVRLIQ